MKKIILPSIFAFIVVLLFNFLTPSLGVAFFHDKASESELDCYDTFVDAVKGSANWGDTAGGVFIYNSDPKTISKNQGENFCLLSKVQMFNESRIFDESKLKITYFPELPSLNDKFNALKSVEEGDFEIKDNSENEYSGRTARGDPIREDIKNYARQVNILGNCLIEFTYRADRTPAMHDDSGFAEGLADAVLETVKTYQVPMLNSEKLQSFCGGKVSGNLSSNQKIQQTKPQQSQQSDQSQSDQVGQPTKQNQTGKDGNLFNIFGANPFQTWLNLKGLAEIAAYIGTDAVIKDAGYLFSSIERAQQKQEAESNELFEEVKFVQEASARFGELRLQDKIRAGEIVKKYDTRVEATDQPVLIKMDSGTLKLHPLNGQTGVIEPESNWPMLKSGALDVIVEPQNDQQFEVQTPNMDLFVIGTEFSVIYDPKKDQTLVAVYKGQVEVKTKTGQKEILSPKGDKPGVVLVSQKLSVWKLVLTGLIFTAVIGGAIFFLKRRGKKISPFKKKK